MESTIKSLITTLNIDEATDFLMRIDIMVDMNNIEFYSFVKKLEKTKIKNMKLKILFDEINKYLKNKNEKRKYLLLLLPDEFFRTNSHDGCEKYNKVLIKRLLEKKKLIM
jgi:hypothetical protein